MENVNSQSIKKCLYAVSWLGTFITNYYRSLFSDGLF